VILPTRSRPTVFSIGDTGLGLCPVTEGIEAVLREIEYCH